MNWDAPYIISPHSPRRLYWASNFVYRTRRSRRLVDAHQPRSLPQPQSRRDPDHGQAVARGLDRAQHVDDTAQQRRDDRRVAAARRAPLRRHRRRVDSGDGGRREELAEGGTVPRRAAVDVRDRRLRLAARGRYRVRDAEQLAARRLQARTSSRAPIAGRRGRTSPATCLRSTTRGRSSRITSMPTCSSWAPSSRCSRRSTAASSGRS